MLSSQRQCVGQLARASATHTAVCTAALVEDLPVTCMKSCMPTFRGGQGHLMLGGSLCTTIRGD